MKYKTKPIIVDAVQWFKLGDHPDVIAFTPSIWEDCDYCDSKLTEHGWFDDHWHESKVIHPGDWIVTEATGNVKQYRDVEFKEKYEPVLIYLNISENNSESHDDSVIPVLSQKKVKKYLKQFRIRPLFGDKVTFKNIEAPDLGTIVILNGRKYKVTNINQLEDNFDIEIESSTNG